MTLNLIETLKTSIYDPKYTKNTKIPFQTFIFQKSILSKVLISLQSELYADFHGPPLAGPKF